MFPPVDTRSPTAVEAAVQAVYQAVFPEGDRTFVRRAFQWAGDAFKGKYAEYQHIDARYHDLEHTLQGTLCMMRLLGRRAAVDAAPALDRRTFELGLLGILLHDTGYLKVQGDDEGTGAKYTLVHVRRSCEFASRLLAEKGFGVDDIVAVQQMIRCTGVNVNLRSIPFASEPVRVAGFALGTSDLLGQMAADDYIDKLPILFEEFRESAEANRDAGAGVTFESADALMRQTPAFWRKYVLPKIENEFGGIHRYLNDPHPDGPNQYVDRVEANIRRLEAALV